MSEQINSMAEVWWGWMWPMLWQVGLLIALVGLIDFVMRRRVWPQVRYALWLLVLLKLALPPGLGLPTSVTSQLQPLARDSVKAQLFSDEISESEHIEGDVPTMALASDEAVGEGGIGGEASISIGQAVVAEETEKGGAELCRRGYLMLGWLSGVVILAGWLVVRFRQLRRAHIGKSGLVELPEWFEELVADAARKLKLRRLPEVSLSRGVVSPAVFGVFRPVLLMPAENISRLCRKEIEHVLLHELAHIKRGDLKVHAVYMVLQIMYWFNPLLWLVRRQLQHLRELCCDATVARILREKTADYRETIVETARRLLAKPVKVGIGLLGLFEDSSRLSVRLRWLEKKTWKQRGLRIATVCVVVAFMCVCVLPMAAAKEKDKEAGGSLAKTGGEEKQKEVSSGDKASSRAWHVMRQWNAGPLLLGLTQKLGKVIVPSRRDEKIWKGVKKGGKLKLNIAVEGDVSGEIFVGFFKDGKWSGEPVQVRSFPGPGEYVVEKLPAGKFQIGAMTGASPVADALGVQQTWPEPIEVKRGQTAAAKVLVSPDFRQRASGVDNTEAARAFVGEWDKMNPDNLLQGRVTGPDGKPIPYAQIVLHEYKTKRASYRMLHSGTDEEGHFYLDKMDWPYRIQVIWDEKLPEALGTRQHFIIKRRALRGRQKVDFKFDVFPLGTAVLKGRVVDQDNKPVGEFHLFVRTKIDWSDWHKDADGDYRVTSYRIPFISEDGSFELSGLPSGVFEARVIPFNVQAYEFHQGLEVGLEDGKTTEAELRVKAKNVLYGRALFEDGKTPAADEIHIIVTVGRGGPGRGVGGVDSDGYFTVHFNDRELEAFKAGWSTIVLIRKDSRQVLGTFPAGLLSAERSKAGVLKVPRVPPKETKEFGTGDPSKSGMYGKKVEPFELLGIDGKTYRLADYKGKVVLLNIFATWCRPCFAELPHLRELNSQFADKGLVILAISHREMPGAVESYARKHSLPYPALVDRRGQATNQFAYRPGQVALPTNVLLDRDHKIAYYGAGFGIRTFDEIRETVEKLLSDGSATSGG